MMAPPVYSDDDASSSEAPASKKQRSYQHPTSFVTWNCNGLLSRCKGNEHELRQLVATTSTPDVLFLQEVRLKAVSSTRRNEPCKQDDQVVQSLFRSDGPFQHYEPVWSLADSRYSGTLTLLHKRLGHLDVSNDSEFSAFSTSSAVELLLKKFSLSKADVGIAETSKKGKAPPPAKQQASIKSFFSTAKKSTNSSIQQEHHAEGRFQFFSFPEMDIVHTYVPNHGVKPESFQRRQEWDEQMLAFIENRNKILLHAGDTNRKLLWAGDLNVARDYRDGTHWHEQAADHETIQEWWTNESKCLMKPGDPNRAPQYIGMPSFTPIERTRFNNILQQGNLLDAWRELHPHGSITSHGHVSKWERPDYTWRGHASKDGSKKAKYEGKGQRLDYFLVNGIDMKDVLECEILGYGSNRVGFCGSDHCPVKLQLRT